MDSKQIFMIVVIVTALSTVMIATPVMAQNMTGENMTGKVSGFGPELLSDNTAPRSECPVDAEGNERCGPQGPPGTDSNGDTNGNGNDDASGDGNGGDSSNGNGNGDNQ
jgi:hypothetical protein